MTETVTVKFERRVSPFEWSASADEIPGATGLGNSMQAALASLIETLPNTLMIQRTQLELMGQELERLRKR